MANIKGRHVLDTVHILEVDSDPTTGGGVAAPTGSLITVNDGSGLYVKAAGGSTAWTPGGGGGGVTTVGTFGSTPTANGATISGTSIFLQPADATHPGVVAASGSQTFGIIPTFLADVSTTGGGFVGNHPTNVYLGASSFYMDFDTSAANRARWESVGPSNSLNAGFSLRSYRANGSNPLLFLDFSPTGNATFLNTLTLNSKTYTFPAAFVAGGALTDAAGNGTLSWVVPAGVTTVGAFGSTPTANGATITGTSIFLQPADATHPGSISLSAQTLGAGLKTFTDGLIATHATNDAASRITVQTTSSGTSSQALLEILDDAGYGMQMVEYSSGFTTSGPKRQSSALFHHNAIAGTMEFLAASNSATSFGFWTNVNTGATERFRINSDGTITAPGSITIGSSLGGNTTSYQSFNGGAANTYNDIQWGAVGATSYKFGLIRYFSGTGAANTGKISIFNAGDAQAGSLNIGAGSGTLGSISIGSYTFSSLFGVGTADQFRVDSSGNTQTSGSLAVTATSTQARVSIGPSTTTALYSGYLTQTWSSLDIYKADATAGSSGLTLGQAQSATATGVGSIAFYNTSGRTVGTDDLRLAMIIGSTGAAVDKGQLQFWVANGVGTLAKAAQINSDKTATFLSTISTVGQNQFLAASGATGTLRLANSDFVFGSAGTDLYFQSGASSGATNYQINVNTGGETAGGDLVIQNSGGNVGIGAAPGAFKLDVTGLFRATGDITSSAGAVTATGSITTHVASRAALDAVTNTARLIVNGSGTSTNGIFDFISLRSGGLNPLHVMTSDTSGNVVFSGIINADGGINTSTAATLALGASNTNKQTFGISGTTLLTLDTTSNDRVTIAGGSVASGKVGLSVTATLPNGGVASRGASFVAATVAGTSAIDQSATIAWLTPGFTGAALTAGSRSLNNVAGTGTTPTDGSFTANWGTLQQSFGTTTGVNIGTGGWASNGATNFGGLFYVTSSSTVGVGVYGSALSSGGTSVGGYFTTRAAGTIPSFTSAALIADNDVLAVPIFLCRDNGTTVFTIADGGAVSATGSLTLGAASAPGQISLRRNDGAIGGQLSNYVNGSSQDAMSLVNGNGPVEIKALSNNTDNIIAFYTSSTTALRGKIDSSGNLFWGTSSLFQIDSSSNVVMKWNSSSQQTQTVGFARSDGSTLGSLFVTSPTGGAGPDTMNVQCSNGPLALRTLSNNSQNSIDIYTGGTTRRGTIDNSGNLFWGTSSLFSIDSSSNVVMKWNSSTQQTQVISFNRSDQVGLGSIFLTSPTGGAGPDVFTFQNNNGTVQIRANNADVTGTIDFLTNSVLRAQISNAGIFKVTTSQNSATYSVVENANTGASAYANFQVRNTTAAESGALNLYTFSTTRTTSNIYPQNGSTIQTGGTLAGGLAVGTLAGPIKFHTTNTLALTIDTSQNATFVGNVVARGTIYVGPATFTPKTDAQVQIAAAGGAQYALTNSSAATDEKTWYITNGATKLSFGAVNDAYNGGNTWLEATRSGFTVPTIEFFPSATSALRMTSTANTMGVRLNADGGIDTSLGTTLSILGTTGTTLNLGRSGQTQALKGNATVAGTLDVTGNASAASHATKTHAAFTGSSNFIQTGAVQTTNATQTTSFTLAIPDTTDTWVQAQVVARDTSGTDRAFFNITTLVFREGGGATLQGSVASVVPAITTTGALTWAATFTTSGNNVLVSVTGAAATTINWACTVTYQTVGGSA